MKVSMDSIIVGDVVKRFGNAEALRGVSFRVREGEIFGLLGPNAGLAGLHRSPKSFDPCH